MADNAPTVSLAEAGRALGISEQKLRRRIARGKIKAVRVGDARGVEWRIPADALPSLAPAGAGNSPGSLEAGAPAPWSEALTALIAELALERERSARLEQERAELYGRLGFFQARLALLEERRALPPAPDGPAQSPAADATAPVEAPAPSVATPPAPEAPPPPAAEAPAVPIPETPPVPVMPPSPAVGPPPTRRWRFWRRDGR
jgi:excisionase family DNA binding protein